MVLVYSSRADAIGGGYTKRKHKDIINFMGLPVATFFVGSMAHSGASHINADFMVAAIRGDNRNHIGSNFLGGIHDSPINGAIIANTIGGSVMAFTINVMIFGGSIL